MNINEHLLVAQIIKSILLPEERVGQNCFLVLRSEFWTLSQFFEMHKLSKINVRGRGSGPGGGGQG